jgi:predicted dehydrogenase
MIKYKATVIGCGRIGCSFDDDPKRKYIDTHVGAYNYLPNVDLVALVDIDKAKAKKYSEKYNVPVIFSNHKDMLKTIKPDIVSICTPPETHLQIIKDCVANGVKGIFCEKPLSNNLKDVFNVVKLCEDYDIVLQIDHQRRFCKLHNNVKDLLKKDKVQSATFYYTAGIKNTGSHLFDLLCFFFGNPKEVVAFKSKCFLCNKDDPNYDGIIKFEDDVFCSIHGCNVKVFLIFELDIITNKHRFVIKNSGFTLDVYNVGDSQFFSGYKELYKDSSIVANQDVSLIVDGVNHLIKCIEEHKVSISSGQDGLKVLKIIDAFEKSAEENKKVVL